MDPSKQSTRALPGSYLRLLDVLATHEADGGRVWLGETGFRVPVQAGAAASWLPTLAGGRRPGMHLDLVPFATDGVGNRYCFYRSANPACADVDAIVFWVLDTARAIPLAENFDAFLDWIGIVSHWTAMRGDDAILDEDHLRNTILPVLRDVGRPCDVLGRIREREPTQRSLLTTLLETQPSSPIGLIWRAMSQLEANDPGGALASCERALRVFPEHVMARLLEAEAYQRTGSVAARLDALTRAIRMPLVYGGDEQLPYLGSFPALDPSWLAEELAMAPLPADDLMFEPIWDLIMAYDPTSASGWLTVSVEYANLGMVQDAITMASNALLFALPEERAPVLGYLGELYGALGAEWHENLAQAEAARITASLPRVN